MEKPAGNPYDRSFASRPETFPGFDDLVAAGSAALAGCGETEGSSEGAEELEGEVKGGVEGAGSVGSPAQGGEDEPSEDVAITRYNRET
jgi:hypothetical protein